jgi:hypothetical protein
MPGQLVQVGFGWTKWESRLQHAKEIIMKVVQTPFAFAPYHIALADMVYHDITTSPSPVFASIALWNGLSALMQRGVQKQDTKEFLDRISRRLTPTSNLSGNAEPRFSGQSVAKTTANIQAARQAANNFGSVGNAESVNDSVVTTSPFALILAQIEIAKQMF